MQDQLSDEHVLKELTLFRKGCTREGARRTTPAVAVYTHHNNKCASNRGDTARLEKCVQSTYDGVNRRKERKDQKDRAQQVVDEAETKDHQESCLNVDCVSDISNRLRGLAWCRNVFQIMVLVRVDNCERNGDSHGE